MNIPSIANISSDYLHRVYMVYNRLAPDYRLATRDVLFDTGDELDILATAANI